ncbi:hypothetical protein QW131_12140 [Roseibium salinum]|nr:hypothetical protein [Roseibium salinum]
MTAAETAAFEADRIVLRLEVRADNEAAIGLYRKSGYRDLGRIDDYYDDGCAALRMEKAPARSGSWIRQGALLFPDHGIHLRARLCADGAQAFRSCDFGRGA